MRSPEKIIKRPLLTEKGSFAQGDPAVRPEEDLDPEQVQPQLCSKWRRDANKIESSTRSRSCGTSMFSRCAPRSCGASSAGVGRHIGRRSNWKRALVTLAAGQKIDFFEGV